MLKSLADLRLGEKAIIQSFKDEIMSLKFLEMGCLPNMEVELVQIAPLGDPICIRTPEYQILMRKAEAATIVVLKIDENAIPITANDIILPITLPTIPTIPTVIPISQK